MKFIKNIDLNYSTSVYVLGYTVVILYTQDTVCNSDMYSPNITVVIRIQRVIVLTFLHKSDWNI
jgi:ABC-type sulfate transport system permease subunit